jgi:Diaminopimelate decarboxylase
VSNPLAPDWLSVPGDANLLDSRLWPDGVARGNRDELTIHGVPASRLVADYGSPLYVVDLDAVRRRAAWIRDVMTSAFEAPGRRVQVYYATKALLAGDVLHVIRQEGLGADVSSAGEWAAATRAGIDPSDIEYQGNNKSDAELHQAVQAGVGAIVLDSAQEVRRVAAVATAVGVTQPVMISGEHGCSRGNPRLLGDAQRRPKVWGLPAPIFRRWQDAIRSDRH